MEAKAFAGNYVVIRHQAEEGVMTARGKVICVLGSDSEDREVLLDVGMTHPWHIKESCITSIRKMKWDEAAKEVSDALKKLYPRKHIAVSVR